jgi:hypothetical protein
MPRRFKDTEDPKKARTDWKKEKNRVQQREDSVQQHAERASVRRGGGVQNLMSRRMGGGAPGGGGPGGGLEGMMRHPAVEFGRQMTGGVGDAASASIRNMVMQRLAQKGLSQDGTGTWQIAGLNRPTDPGLAIRNSAISAMDPSGEMLRRVLGASPMPGAIRGMPSGMGGVPSPGLGAGSLPIGPQNGMPLPPVRPPMPMPNPGGMQSVPPGLPGGPPMPGSDSVYTPVGGITEPIPPKPPIPMGKGPSMAPPPAAPPFPPQGQGVGRTTTPTGAEIDPTKYPPTGPKPTSLGLPPAGTAGGLNQPPPVRPDWPSLPPGSGASMQGANRPGGSDYPMPSGSSALPIAGMAGGLNQAAPNGGYAHPSSALMQPPVPSPGLGGVAPMPRTEYGTPMVPASSSGGGSYDQAAASLAKQFPPPGAPSGSMPPPSAPNDIYRQPGTNLPNQHPTPTPSAGGPPPVKQPPYQPPPPGSPPPAQNLLSGQPQNFANPNSALTQRLQQGRPGTPPAPGRAPTPMVAPGAMPGQSTPFNPAQMAQQGMKLPAIPRPTQGAFGTPGQTQVPGARQPVSLANLGQSIQATVASRVGASQQGLRPGVSPATPGSPVGNSLDDLGERIRAAVAGNNGNVQPAAPGAGGTNLGQATTSIMDRVRQQLSQAGMPAGGQPQGGLPPMTNGTTPFPTTGGGLNVPTAPGAPSTGMMQGGAPVPPGGAPSGMAAPSTTTAPSGGIGAPTGTINCQFGYGCGGDWSTVNQYDATFAAEGAKYGVDPAMLKAMAVIESGGQMIEGPAGAYGIMQVKPGIWGGEAARLGYDLNTPEGQIGFAAAFLGGAVQGVSGSTPQERFLNSYYPTDCYTCPPADQDNGITQEVYWNNMQGLIGDINAAGGGTTQAVDPTTGAPVQLPPGANSPINGGGPVAGEPGAMDPPAGPNQTLVPPPSDTGLIPGMDQPRSDGTVGPVGPPVPTGAPGTLGDSTTPPRTPTQSDQIGIYYPPSGGIAAAAGTDETYMTTMTNGVATADSISSEYKGPVAGDWYRYQLGHGAAADEHAAYDIAIPSNTPLTTVDNLTGTVECSGCGSYCTGGVDANGNLYCDGVGIGEVRVKLDNQGSNQITMLYGHLMTSDVQAGQYVNVGDSIGNSGYAGTGPHLHLEARAYCPGQGYDQDYKYVDPTLVADGYYQSHDACAE